MQKCLFEKLAGSANNPDLPIIETLQQFTLNAITASGNANVTEIQTYALNHFFYTVGAIDNSGIWTKLKYVFIPFLGNTVGKSFVDYLTNTNYSIPSSASLVMRNGGVVGSSLIAKPVVEGSVNGISTSNLSIVALYESDKNINLDSMSYVKLGSINVCAQSNANFHMINITTGSPSSPAVRGMLPKEGNNYINGVGMTINQYDTDHYNPYFITANHSIVGATSIESLATQSEETVTDGNLVATFLANESAAIQLLIVGQYLTPTELQTLMTACDTLKQAFCTI